MTNLFSQAQTAASLSGLNIVGTISTNISGQVIYHTSGQNQAQISGEGVRIMGIINTSPAHVATQNSDAGVLTINYLHTAAYLHGLHRANSGWARVELVTPVSGEGFKLLIANSGQQHGVSQSLNTAAAVVITALSGGTVLGGNVPTRAVFLKNKGPNTSMFIGGVSGNSPFSGAGYELESGQNLRLEIANLNLVKACATTSGQLLSYVAEVP